MKRQSLAIACLMMLTSWGLYAFPSAAQSENPSSAATLLNVLWRVKVPRTGGNIDYMTVPDAAGRDTYPSDGAIFYVPKNPVAGTAELNRLWNPLIPDHMDSEGRGGGGYSLEVGPGFLGYPWSTSNATPGLAQILRSSNPSNSDHAIQRGNETLLGYTTIEGFTRWGYPRYNNLDESQALLTITNTTSLGQTVVSSDKKAGGCVWQWTYRGVPYIDNSGYGRMLASTLFFTDTNNICNYSA